jgi:hypothetical protein
MNEPSIKHALDRAIASAKTSKFPTAAVEFVILSSDDFRPPSNPSTFETHS